MRLEPSEEAMYRRMDLKDHLLIVILIMGFIASLSFFLLANPNSQVIGLGAIISSLAGMGALEQEEVRAVIAETEPDGLASIRVLGRCGFKKWKTEENLWWRLDG